MQSRNPVDVGISQIRQRNEIAVEERQPVIIVFDRQRLSHIGRNHVDKTEHAMIFALTNAVETRAIKFNAQFLINVFVERYQFPATVGVLDKKLNLLIGKRKTQIDDVNRIVVVDREDRISRAELELVGKRIGVNTNNFALVNDAFLPTFDIKKGSLPRRTRAPPNIICSFMIARWKNYSFAGSISSAFG